MTWKEFKDAVEKFGIKDEVSRPYPGERLIIRRDERLSQFEVSL